MIPFHKKSWDSKTGKKVPTLTIHCNLHYLGFGILVSVPILILLNISVMIRIKTGEQPAETSVWIISAFLIFPFKLSCTLPLTAEILLS